MVIVEHDPKFISFIKKISHSEKIKIVKKIKKIIQNPEIGKPMKFARKGTREVYAGAFRLSYAFTKNKIVFLEIYHKDTQ